MNLTFKFQTKFCNNLIPIIREPIDIVQASQYSFPILLFADIFHQQLTVIKLKIMKDIKLFIYIQNIFCHSFIALSNKFFFFIVKSGAINFDVLHQLLYLYTLVIDAWIRHKFTLENRYGFWPQTGCVTVPGYEAAFLVARQRFPYRSRFNFSAKNMENMLLSNAICDIMHIDFSRKIYCGANDASIGF